ncbi:unnamed protein product, partial [Meganyctiphanes norvegica]
HYNSITATASSSGAMPFHRTKKWRLLAQLSLALVAISIIYDVLVALSTRYNRYLVMQEIYLQYHEHYRIKDEFETVSHQYFVSKEHMRLRMVSRKRLIEQVCQQYSAQLLDVYAHQLERVASWNALNRSLLANPDVLMDRTRRIAWCKVPKVASTSLVHGLLRVVGGGDLIDRTPRGQLHMMLRRLMPHPVPGEKLPLHLTTFMATRHPFARLLSAYRDKILNRREVHQFQKFKNKYGLDIIKKYRQEQKSLLFADIPTFYEFVDYLLDTPVWKYNEHWRPYYLTCTPCHHNYDVILHLETMQEDADYLVNLTGIQELKPPKLHMTRSEQESFKVPEEEHLQDLMDDEPGGEIKKELRNTSRIIDKKLEYYELEKKYFSHLNRYQILELYKIYHIDFEMFGYSITPYNEFVDCNELYTDGGRKVQRNNIVRI